MTLKCNVLEILEAVESLAPPALAEPWDNVGLQVGDPAGPVSRAMTCLELTGATLAEARKRGVQAVVAHHPLIFRPLAALRADDPTGALAFGLIRSGIALIAAHTNLDAAAWSTSHALAELCGLEIERPLAPAGETAGGEPVGLGALARPVGPMPLGRLAARIRDALGCSHVRVTGKPLRKIRRVALCPGAGGGFVALAAERADALITGELNHHQAIEAAARGLAVIAVGHFESEAIVAGPLAERLSEALSGRGVEVFSARCDFNPFATI